ncbi:glutathione S-transferase [Tanacetum coccineum]
MPESRIILEYLDEIYPDVHQILPKCPLARADNRFWATYIDNMLCPLYEELRQTPGKEGKDAVKKQFYEVSELLEGAYTKMSNGKAYFGGDYMCYLDLVLGSLIPLTEFIEETNDFKVFDEVRTPGLARWANCMHSNEAIKSVFPRKETLVDFYAMLHIVKPPRVV